MAALLAKHGARMISRYEYRPPGLLAKVALIFRSPHRWRSSLRAWVFDKEDGMLFQLAEDEAAALAPLVSRMGNGSIPLEVAAAFDLAARAIVARRLGYGFEWVHLARRTEADWDTWLNGALRRLRW